MAGAVKNTTATQPATRNAAEMLMPVLPFDARTRVISLIRAECPPVAALSREFDRAARLAAIPAGESPANRRSPVTVVVISSDGEGDRSVESLEVKVPEGWSVPV